MENKGKHAIWGLDTTVQPNGLEIGRADNASDITGIKAEWRSVYPNMKFQLMLNAQPNQQPVPEKWA